MEQISSIQQTLNLNPWCGICGGKEFHFEEHVVPGANSMAEAAPILVGLQYSNIKTRQKLDEIGATYDSRQAKRN